jgi:hypothetical protein
MSLSDLASLGSLLSGVAVLVSLVFLYFQVRQVNQQVRQAEKNQRATIAQVRASRTAEMAMKQTDPAVATAFRKAMAGAEDLTPTELQQFLGGMVRATITNHEDIFLQRQHGLVEDAAYRAWLSQVTATWSNPAFRAGWRLQRPAAGADFAAFLDKLIAETPVRPARSAERLVAEWKSAWDEVTRASP